MGQGSSQPERTGDAEPRAAGRAAATFRSAISARRPQEHGYDQAGLLQNDEPGPTVTPRRRTRNSINRLSQLVRWNDVSELQDHAQDTPEVPPARRSHRMRIRLHDILQREGGHAFTLRPSTRAQRRPIHLSAGADTTNDEQVTPRLPSIDLSSTFDDAFESAQSAAIRPESEDHQNDSPQRRSTTRFNSLRHDPILPAFRNLTSSLRRRRSQQRSITSMGEGGNEDQATMLSRLLSVAAAATAATLMGDDPHAMSEARSLTGGTGLGDLAGGGEDGSFDGFLRALQNGRIASALRQGTNEGDADGDGSPAPPLNFFRMFRFGPSGGAAGPQQTPASNSEGEQGRLIPIIIVGIRSISQPSGSNSAALSEDLPPFIDALGNFPSPLPAHAFGDHGHDSIDAILRPPQNGTSFRHRRRASLGGFGMGRGRLNDRMDDQRDHRSPDRRRDRPWSVASSSGWEPRPPPATPASPSPELSRLSSRESTPGTSRPASLLARDSSSHDLLRNSLLNRNSQVSPLSAHTEETASLHSTHSSTNLLSDLEPFRLHRRSETTPNIHYPRFASGHPRRNGMVEPDRMPSISRGSSRSRTDSPEETRSGDARSWIIYVLGGSYPENHPILTTPSLFTENPTYEDMMLLSALLGPAKAPVATDEDVQSAGGVYTIVSASDIAADADKTAELVAIATASSSEDHIPERIYLEPAQRCLVCLCDFEKAETARKLVKCNHLFHKECIDQWLTTGRNSCPLCREQGVDEKPKPEGAEVEISEEEEEETRTLRQAGVAA